MHIAQGRNSQLRELYRDNIRRFPADIIVPLNKAIFNKRTSWRTRGRALISQEAPYKGNIYRGTTWSICAAAIINQYS